MKRRLLKVHINFSSCIFTQIQDLFSITYSMSVLSFDWFRICVSGHSQLSVHFNMLTHLRRRRSFGACRPLLRTLKDSVVASAVLDAVWKRLFGGTDEFWSSFNTVSVKNFSLVWVKSRNISLWNVVKCEWRVGNKMWLCTDGVCWTFGLKRLISEDQRLMCWTQLLTPVLWRTQTFKDVFFNLISLCPLESIDGKIFTL